ncbi:MAG: hypothetical protein HYY49_10380 [Ignavibacteriales bacterium]|nr:hypothetical protein [Ignavibacteriales bacterium]
MFGSLRFLTDSIRIHYGTLPNTTYYLPEYAENQNVKQAVIFSVGFLTPRLTCELINLLMNRNGLPRWIQGVGGGLYQIMRFDMPVQYLWGLTYAVFSPSRGKADFTGLVQSLFTDRFWDIPFYVRDGHPHYRRPFSHAENHL